jgi:stage II sporulation protein D
MNLNPKLWRKHMALRMLFLLLTLLPLASVQAGWFDTMTNYFRKPAIASPPKIKVLVVHDQPGAVLEVKGKYKIVDPHTGEHISTRFIGKRKFIQAVRDGLKWGEEFPGIHQLLIIPDERVTTTIVDGIEYHGQIYIYDIGGSISVVNRVFLEDYLSSILAQRYRQEISPEALAAIAIAARTSAYYWLENSKSPYWSVDGRQVGYQGYAAVNQGTPIEHAIYKTRHMVMSQSLATEEGMHPFLAEWKQSEHSDKAARSTVSLITLEEADAMAKQGAHAAQILAQAFPGMKIELIYSP